MIPAFWYLGRGEMLGAKRAPNEGPLGNTIELKDRVKRCGGTLYENSPYKKSDRCG
jgi:hypothetical protein